MEPQSLILNPFKKMISKLLFIPLTLLVITSITLAHMEMAFPPPRRSKYSEYYRKNGNIDYNMNSPLNPSQWPYPCRGFPVGPAEFTFKAGSSLKVQLAGSATHGGGHCQFALQYDNGQFVVFHTIFDECPLSKNYTVTIPSTAPNGKAAFVWTWVNAIGNREYYMNCADVNIDGPAQSCMDGLEQVVLNYPGYPTIPEFSQDPTHGKQHFNNRKPARVCRGGASAQSKNKSKKPKKKPNTPPGEASSGQYHRHN
ncbi:uncharacterized protein VTP21DRAFT_7222 [Calcarisporiella thermophila]|uniref:uncharacterized protein n=1 Tax=Calcarisporiella thermophila TaxID=911321 RepID=UPI003743DFC4